MKKKSILIDFNNMAIRCLYGKDVIIKDQDIIIDINWDLWKLYLFSNVYEVFYKVKDINEIVLAVDSKKYWRKMFYPNYKYKRATQREKSDMDWDLFYEKYKKFQDEIKTHLPLKVLNILTAEGDDIIGVICLNTPEDQTFEIISVDSDFLQLSSDRVNIYNPLKKSKVSHPNPEMFIQELCLMGQSKDGIFNVITPVDYPIIPGKKLPGFGPKAAEKAFITGLDTFLKGTKKYEKNYKDENGIDVKYKGIANLQERFDQNRILIDFKKIPNEIVKVIMNNYNNYTYPKAENILTFFQKNDWREFNENFTKVELNLMRLY